MFIFVKNCMMYNMECMNESYFCLNFCSLYDMIRGLIGLRLFEQFLMQLYEYDKGFCTV